VTHVLVILAFILGIAALAIFDHLAVLSPTYYEAIPSGVATGQVSAPSVATGFATGALFFVPFAVAAVMGIHGLGEGWDFGSVAAGVSGTTDIITAFGGWNPLVSYPIHKFLEASIISILYATFVQRNSIAKRAIWHLPILGLLFGLTSVIGSIAGYFIAFNTVFFYAFGVTAGIYAAIRLAGPLISNTKGNAGTLPTYLGAKSFLFIGIGFFLLYSAALLH